MIVHIPKLLELSELAEFRKVLDGARWVDGRVTAGHQSVRVKNNQQLEESSREARELGDRVLRALERSPLFMTAALPLRVFPPLFNRYSEGMGFGLHVDNSIRQVTGTAHRIRTDVSATLFLSDPDEYEGGELIIEDAYGAHSAKLPAGDLVVYPASSLHRVTPVRSGARVASFFWVQSMIRSDAHRTLLFELDLATQRVRQELETYRQTSGGDAPVRPPTEPDPVVQLTHCYHNLLRNLAEL